MKLIISGLFKVVIGMALVACLVFLPAGTLNYFEGWLFFGVLFVPLLIMGIILLLKAPELLKKRLDGKEKQGAQKGVVAVSGLMFIIGFVVAGLDFRFRWSDVSIYVTAASAAVFLLSYVLYAVVLKENAYLSRTVKVEKEQKLVDTGVYGIVRHPMYSATILMFLSIPLILGSLYSLIVFAIYPVLIVIRVINEERLLTDELYGYDEYKKRVKYRLIPFIW